MTEIDRWRKSTYSSSNGGNCTEVATAPGAVLVRDSKNLDDPRQGSAGTFFSYRAWGGPLKIVRQLAPL